MPGLDPGISSGLAQDPRVKPADDAYCMLTETGGFMKGQRPPFGLLNPAPDFRI
jgi:hypothetical protein